MPARTVEKRPAHDVTISDGYSTVPFDVLAVQDFTKNDRAVLRPDAYQYGAERLFLLGYQTAGIAIWDYLSGYYTDQGQGFLGGRVWQWALEQRYSSAFPPSPLSLLRYQFSRYIGDDATILEELEMTVNAGDIEPPIYGRPFVPWPNGNWPTPPDNGTWYTSIACAHDDGPLVLVAREMPNYNYPGLPLGQFVSATLDQDTDSTADFGDAFAIPNPWYNDWYMWRENRNGFTCTRSDGTYFWTITNLYVSNGNVPTAGMDKWFLIRWTPNGGNGTWYEIEFDNDDDNELFHAAPSTLHVGARGNSDNLSVAQISSNRWGWSITFDAFDEDDNHIFKTWQINPEFTEYREINFLPGEGQAFAEQAFDYQETDPNNTSFTPAMAVDGSYVISVTRIGRVLAAPYLDPPEWPKVTGTPLVRAWTFSLDDHDYYVLRRGLLGTTVWDSKSRQTTDWAHLDNPVWAVNCGCNWEGGKGKAETNVIVGDDTTGQLYFLVTTPAYDEGNEGNEFFDRIATTYIAARGRDFIPCYNVYLSCDMQGDVTKTVKLEYSDDDGITYANAGEITGLYGQTVKEYGWTSLGQISAPGRVFRITHNGIAARLDGLDINDTGEQGNG